jgi:hypothetical protein
LIRRQVADRGRNARAAGATFLVGGTGCAVVVCGVGHAGERREVAGEIRRIAICIADALAGADADVAAQVAAIADWAAVVAAAI